MDFLAQGRPGRVSTGVVQPQTAAVDIDRLAGDVAGLIAGEERHDLGDLFGLADAL